MNLRAYSSRAEQSRAEQSRAEQSRAEQSRALTLSLVMPKIKNRRVWTQGKCLNAPLVFVGDVFQDVLHPAV